MGVRDRVFGSKSEAVNYYKLRRTWGEKYHIYHNLPYMNVLNFENLVDLSDWTHPKPIILNDLDKSRLKKTSIDFTLCDKNESPILCIEFDGLQDGFSAGLKYIPRTSSDPWRQTITELKLRVAHGSLFPFFVVGTTYFKDISDDIRLTIIDGIIGEVLSSIQTRNKFQEGFDPCEIGFSKEDFDRLSPPEQHELIQDWVLGVEVQAEFDNNPICVKRGELETELKTRGYSYTHKFDPDIDHIEDVKERAIGIEKAKRIGARVVFHTDDLGDIEGEVWLPRFKVAFYSDFGLCEDIAALFALNKIRKMRHLTSA
mgnify:FL=1